MSDILRQIFYEDIYYFLGILTVVTASVGRPAGSYYSSSSGRVLYSVNEAYGARRTLFGGATYVDGS